MFGQSTLPEAKNRKTWMAASAFSAQLVVVAILILIPTLYIRPLTVAELTTMLLRLPRWRLRTL